MRPRGKGGPLWHCSDYCRVCDCMLGLASWILDEANRREAVPEEEEMDAPELRRIPCKREERKPRLVLVGRCGAARTLRRDGYGSVPHIVHSRSAPDLIVQYVSRAC